MGPGFRTLITMTNFQRKRADFGGHLGVRLGARFNGVRRLLCLTSAVLLVACSGQELYGKLSEQQANEMVALLRGSGLTAEKVPSKEVGQYSVTTSAADFAQAVQALRSQGYPKDTHETLGQVFKKEGFVSSPLEERARLTYALSQEIGNTISSIDGVLVARVHVAVPEKDPLSDAPKPASASVFIKHRAGIDLAPRLGQIKALVVNAIEGLPYDNVTVAFFPSDPWPMVGTKPAQDGVAALNSALYMGGAVGGAVLLLSASLWAWSRRRTSAATPPTHGGDLAVMGPSATGASRSGAVATGAAATRAGG